MRKAGAQARYVLMNSAAKHWEVPISELTTSNSHVHHGKTNQKIGYGDLVPFLEMPETLPDYSEAQLKNPKEFQLIGKDIPRTEIPAKVDGSAIFAIDIRMPEMIYGVLERGKLHGSKPSLTNEAEILAMEGVLKIIPLDYAIGIVAKTLEQALNAKQSLKIDWSESKASGHNSQEVYATYEKIASQNEKGKVIIEIGDVAKARRTAAKTYELDYKNDYVYHAQMEPLNAVVQVAEEVGGPKNPGHCPGKGKRTPTIFGRWIWEKKHERFCRGMYHTRKRNGTTSGKTYLDQGGRCYLWGIPAAFPTTTNGQHRC